MREYVLIGFSDGDARVYDPEDAKEQMDVNKDSDAHITRTELARGNDRLVLIQMAVLARGDRGRSMADMTAEGEERRRRTNKPEDLRTTRKPEVGEFI